MKPETFQAERSKPFPPLPWEVTDTNSHLPYLGSCFREPKCGRDKKTWEGNVSKGRKQKVVVQFDEGFVKSQASASNGKAGGTKYHAHYELDFTKEGQVEDLDEQDRKRILAMMIQARERALAPWCPECNVHKVGRISKEKDAPYDNMCGICSRISAEFGPREVLTRHNNYCGSCSNQGR
jgi:hypothetical protein